MSTENTNTGMCVIQSSETDGEGREGKKHATQHGIMNGAPAGTFLSNKNDSINSCLIDIQK